MIGALEAALEVTLRTDVADAPRLTPWVGRRRVALVVLALLAAAARPFAVPAALWLLAAASPSVDGAWSSSR